MSSLRTRVIKCPATASLAESGESSATAPRQKTRPASAVADDAFLDEHGQELLDEERVALGRLAHAMQERLRHRLAEEARDEVVAFIPGEWLEQDGRGVQLASTPRRPDLEQLGAGHADHEDGRFASPVDQLLDEVEEDPLAPVAVIQNDDQRPPARE